jgi:hypothetical protein
VGLRPFSGSGEVPSTGQCDPFVVEADFREERREAEPVVDRGPDLALILVNDENTFSRPTQLDGPIDESILTIGRFAIGGDLLRGGLADADNGQWIG